MHRLGTSNDAEYIPGMLSLAEKYRMFYKHKYGKGGYDRRVKFVIGQIRKQIESNQALRKKSSMKPKKRSEALNIQPVDSLL